MAKKGYQLTEVDLNPQFIQIAKKDAQEQELTIDYYIEKDILTIDYKQAFDTVFLPFSVSKVVC